VSNCCTLGSDLFTYALKLLNNLAIYTVDL
jgi:hypothetical protein